MNQVLKPFDLVFDLTCPYFNLTRISSRITFWYSFIKIQEKLWPLEGERCFKAILPSDLVFDPTWPIFKLNHDIIKMNILGKFYEDRSKTVAFRG